MQDKLMQAQTQPFIKLAQSNMELLTRFSTSPEVSASANQLFQQASESAMNLMHSGAYAQMVQGMWKNYAEFVAELSQNSMLLFSEGQAAMTRQAQEATKGVIDMADVRGRRAR